MSCSFERAPRCLMKKLRSQQWRGVVRFAAASLLAGVLAGCAARAPTAQPVPKYVSPASGPTARLVTRAAVATGDLYGVYLYDEADGCAGPRSLGVGSATRHPASVDVAAGRMQTVGFFLVTSDKRMCGVRWSFIPQPGKTYLLNAKSIAVSAAFASGGCIARVMDMSDPDNIKPEPTALRRNPQSTLQCLPLSQSKTTSALADKDAAHAGSDAVLNQGATASDLQGLIGH